MGSMWVKIMTKVEELYKRLMNTIYDMATKAGGISSAASYIVIVLGERDEYVTEESEDLEFAIFETVKELDDVVLDFMSYLKEFYIEGRSIDSFFYEADMRYSSYDLKELKEKIKSLIEGLQEDVSTLEDIKRQFSELPEENTIPYYMLEEFVQLEEDHTLERKVGRIVNLAKALIRELDDLLNE